MSLEIECRRWVAGGRRAEGGGRGDEVGVGRWEGGSGR